MADTSKEVVLKVAGISKRFGGLQALSDVGMTIRRGQVYGLIGPNGAGKTTFFNVITGLYTPDTGSFELAGQPYAPHAVHLVAKAGIARTFQNIRLFADMTALENVMVGRHIRTHSGLLGAIFRTKGFKAEEAAITLMIESVWSKRRIFEVYLNVIEWGNGVFGAEAAARHYFGVGAAQLTPEQAARLAGMVPSPRFYDRNRGAPGLAAKAAVILARMPSARIP